MAARFRSQVIVGHVAPFFSGSNVAIRPTYQVQIKQLTPGIRESIRDAHGLPTNCDECKPWMGDIAANAAQKGIGPYGWYVAQDPPPFVKLAKPLSQCRVGFVGTSGCYAVGDRAYFHKEDTSIRPIASDTPLEDLRFSHLTENYLTDARRDPNCVFPLESLRRLAADGVIGSVAKNVFSCMGANYSLKNVQERLTPKMVELLLAEGVDAALIVPM